MKKMMIGFVLVAPLFLNAELNNIQKGDAFVQAFKYSQELRAEGMNNLELEDSNVLCINKIKNDKELFKNKSREYTQLFFDNCVENLTK